MRKDCEIVFYIDADMAMEDGIEFRRSTNNVLLTAGIKNWGELPPKYISSVWDIKKHEHGQTHERAC